MSDRLDVALVARGLARSRTQAQALIASGTVRIAGAVARRASQPVTADALVTVDAPDPWVSRGAHKLLGALDALGWEEVPERVLDAGASTGGFTQVLLGRGARSVYAVDVGHGQLDPSLRGDPRVRVRERLNLRDLAKADLDDELVDLVVGDVSFISLTVLLDPLFSVLTPSGSALLLVKPQFEVGRERLGEGGVVRSASDREQAVDDVVATARTLGWHEQWRGESVLPGPAGNIEWFVHFARDEESSVHSR